MPGNLSDTLAISAMIQCLVAALSEQIDEGTYQHDCHPMMVRQNKWRACRFGTSAMLVNSYTYEVQSLSEIVGSLIKRLEPTADALGCSEYLERTLEIASGPSWADRQQTILAETGDRAEVVRQLTALSRLSDA